MNEIEAILVDGDIVRYRCAFAAEHNYYLVSEEIKDDHLFIHGTFDNFNDTRPIVKEHPNALVWKRTVVEPVENALNMTDAVLESIVDKFPMFDHMRIFLSGKDNFREKVYPLYKANRETMAKPTHYKAIKDWLVSEWDAEVTEGIEADDALGIEQTDRSVIVSNDKDLDQIPGWHFNWVTGDLYKVDPKDGMTKFYEQLLSGDPTDNIPGLVGIGPAKAKKALEDCPTPAHMAAKVYAMYNGDLPTITRNAELLWIRRKNRVTNPFYEHYKDAIHRGLTTAAA